MAEGLEVKKSGIYGRGCYARKHFPARKKIALYAIKVITLGEDTAIDGAVGGDATAYINHSCAPNAFMRIVPGNRVAFFALRDINPGEEITMNYRDPTHPEVCRCGAPNCRSNKKRKRLSPPQES
jgi:hypothetical protein